MKRKFLIAAVVLCSLVALWLVGWWLQRGIVIEGWVVRYDAWAEAVSDQEVRVAIKNTSIGKGIIPTDNLRIYATTENGDMVEVEMRWPHPDFEIGDIGVGTYIYGKNPKGKKIKVIMKYFPPLGNPTTFRPWEIVVS